MSKQKHFLALMLPTSVLKCLLKCPLKHESAALLHIIRQKTSNPQNWQSASSVRNHITQVATEKF